MLRACIDCGDSFEVESGEFWKIRCLPCFLRRKAGESDGARRLPANRLVQHTRPDVAQENALRQRLAWLQEDIDELEVENGRLRRQLSEIAARLDRAGSLADEFHENLPRLIQLVHPDKHGNSPASLKATQWLLSVRQSAPALVEEEVSS